MTKILTFIIILAATWINAFGSMNLKLGAAKFNLNIIEQLKNKPFLIGAALFAVSSVLYLIALKLENLSIVYPLTSLSYIWVAILSHRKFGEALHKKKMAAISLIIIGIALINLTN